ncbi:inactive protein FRIGIDA-like [Tasmannia lanceolata]|uniref:inactive protein FRIGIDA-like n=1 Tax=Tasmannia lanceolata TaxID=3420 RepID=UPI004063CC20
MASVKVEQVPFSQSQDEAAEQVELSWSSSSHSSLVKSCVGELNCLSSALSIFTKQWNELEQHLHSIQKSIQKKLNDNPEDHPLSEMERICESMKSRGLRRYVARHFHDINKLRDEVCKALKLAPNPSRLVLDCIGTFYLQGRKAYTINSPIVAIRRAWILILEFFLFFSQASIIIDPCVKAEAEPAAVAWRTRLLHEGGIANASPDDALALLLFVASFGIPSDFASDLLYQLICLGVLRKKSKLRKKAQVLRLSPLLVDRVQGLTDA